MNDEKVGSEVKRNRVNLHGMYFEDMVRACEYDALVEANAELLAALKNMSEMYGYCWDLVDGGLLCMEINVPRFEAAHEVAHNLITKHSETIKNDHS